MIAISAMQLLPPPRIPPYLVRIGNRVGHGADDSESVSPNPIPRGEKSGARGGCDKRRLDGGSVTVFEIRRFSKRCLVTDDQRGDLFLRPQLDVYYVIRYIS